MKPRESRVGAGLDCDQCGELARNIGCSTSPASYECEGKESDGGVRVTWPQTTPTIATRGTTAARFFIAAASASQPRRQTLPQSLVTGKCDVQPPELGLRDDGERSFPARRGARKALTPSVARHLARSGEDACNRARAAAATASAPRSAVASRQVPLAPPRPANTPES